MSKKNKTQVAIIGSYGNATWLVAVTSDNIGASIYVNRVNKIFSSIPIEMRKNKTLIKNTSKLVGDEVYINPENYSPNDWFEYRVENPKQSIPTITPEKL